jgi:hypothetical protein
MVRKLKHHEQKLLKKVGCPSAFHSLPMLSSSLENARYM